MFSGWTYSVLGLIHGGREPEACTDSVSVFRTSRASHRRIECEHDDHTVTVSGEYIEMGGITKIHSTTVTCRCSSTTTSPDTEADTISPDAEEEARAMWGKR